ncbi:MAG: lipase [Glaciecola sp.]|jgi:lipase
MMDGHAVGDPAILGDRYRRRHLALTGGRVCVGEWQADAPTVLALHGISSNHLLWTWAALADEGLNIVAPDLRGRGGSDAGRPGIAHHVDDVFAVMDALELDRVSLTGMSMGGYVAVAMAARQPDRFNALVLVDGGIPMALDPAGAEPFLADIAHRGATDNTFASVAAYTRSYLAKFDNDLDLDDPVMQAFMAWNLTGLEPGLHPRLPGANMVGDARDVFFDAPVAQWLTSLHLPIDLLHAEAGLPSEPPADWAKRLPNLHEELVLGADHASIVMGPSGGANVARLLRHAVQQVTADE